ncbi:MAG TPA: tetratricopeptide repeat protein, partial [Silvibacterium sp.]|nr:tetratricopeptide repeat protein [Silvibacterium sp.]
PASRASDLFAFGVLLHEVFTGERPAEKSEGSPVTPSSRLGTSAVPSVCADLIRGLLDEDPARRCAAFDQALEPLGLKRHEKKKWTRRQFAGMAAAAACSFTTVGWFERDPLYNATHPLPGKRFVALLPWPKTSDSSVIPMLTGVLTAIKGELSRLEAFDHNLFVISPDDLNQDLTGAAHLKDVCDPLGANLALAASGGSKGGDFHLSLRLLDPATAHPVREKHLTCALQEITSLPARAADAARKILNLRDEPSAGAQVIAGTRSVPAFTAYQAAETFRKQPNDSGLDAAIEEYKEAVDLDPRFALAHARLGQAYAHLYGLRRDPGALRLARQNAERALALDPELVDGHLSVAVVLEQAGDEKGALDQFAKALALDPSDTTALLWQADVYGRLDQWPDAEKCYQRVLAERPNYWLVYNQLGFALHQQGKYRAAIEQFQAASLAAPKSSRPLSNLGGEYLQIGEFAEAANSLKKSFALEPHDDLAAANISLALRYQGKSDEALPFAQKAVELNPTEDTNWLELGDCYSSLHRPREARNAYLNAAQQAERHLQTDTTNGPAWMLLALYRVKSGSPQNASALIQKAESMGAKDMDSQIYKARILELLGKRDDALATLENCFRNGATALQVTPFPDMQSLRSDPRYLKLVQSNSPTTKTS